jgi:hypothetical protein
MLHVVLRVRVRVACGPSIFHRRCAFSYLCHHDSSNRVATLKGEFEKEGKMLALHPHRNFVRCSF